MTPDDAGQSFQLAEYTVVFLDACKFHALVRHVIITPFSPSFLLHVQDAAVAVAVALAVALALHNT